MNGKTLRFSYTLIGSIFFAYVLFRAINVGVTHDEAATIKLSANSFRTIIFTTLSANNHILNTVLIKLLLLAGNNSLFLARLPSLLSFIPYLYFSYKITSKHLTPIVGLGCFTLLTCNPFLLEFFSLARGYGLSLALMLGSLYYASENIKSFSLSSLSKSLGLGALSVWTVLSMAYYWAALALALNFMIYQKEDTATLRNSIKRSLLIASVLALLTVFPILRLIIYGELYYGGTTNFYHDTLLSLARHSLALNYEQELTPNTYLLLNIFLSTLISIVSLSFFQKKLTHKSRDLFTIILISVICLIITAHHLFGVKYPIDRVGLFIYSLACLCLFFCLNELKSYIRNSISLLLTIGFLFNFLSSANTYKTIIWDYDAHTEEILNKINKQGELKNKVVSLQSGWIFESSIDFYINHNYYPFIKILKDSPKSEFTQKPDYLLLASENISEHRRSLAGSVLIPKTSKDDIIMEYPKENVVVYNLRDKDERQRLVTP